MRWPAPLAPGLLAAALLPLGCAETRVPPLGWDACTFLGTVDQVQGKASPATMPWIDEEGLPLHARFTQSRCEYLRPAAPDAAAGPASGAPWWTSLSVVARLSRILDRDPSGQLRLLAQQGYPELQRLTSPEGEPLIWAVVRDESAPPPSNVLQAELHGFRSEPCRQDASTWFHAYFILRYVGTDGRSDLILDAAIRALSEVKKLASPAAQSLLERVGECPSGGDAGPPGDGPRDPPDAGTDAGTEPAADGPPPSDAAAPGLPLEAFAPAIAGAHCAKVAACCPALAEPTCQATLEGTLAVIAQLARDSIARGALAYSPEAAGACLDSFTRLSCAELGAVVPKVPCLESLQPRLPIGGLCHDSLECAGGFCASEPGDAGAGGPDGGGAPSACRPRLAEGQDCQEDAMCASGSCPRDLRACAPPGSPLTCPR
jgi:hypothetical protein